MIDDSVSGDVVVAVQMRMIVVMGKVATRRQAFFFLSVTLEMSRG